MSRFKLGNMSQNNSLRKKSNERSPIGENRGVNTSMREPGGSRLIWPRMSSALINDAQACSGNTFERRYCKDPEQPRSLNRQDNLSFGLLKHDDGA